MKEAITGQEEVALCLEDIKKINRTLLSDGEKLVDNRGANQSKGTSFGIFAQPYQDQADPERWHLVFNGSFPGFGKMFSRFLHIFDSSVTNDLRQWNQQLNRDELLLENHDASYFNANLHPPLLPYEIWMPNGNNTLPPDKQIPITDIEVRFNRSEGGLQP